MRLAAALLAAKLDLWEIDAVGQIGLELLRTAGTADVPADVTSELRERLVEREFFEARGL